MLEVCTHCSQEILYIFLEFQDKCDPNGRFTTILMVFRVSPGSWTRINTPFLLYLKYSTRLCVFSISMNQIILKAMNAIVNNFLVHSCIYVIWQHKLDTGCQNQKEWTIWTFIVSSLKHKTDFIHNQHSLLYVGMFLFLYNFPHCVTRAPLLYFRRSCVALYFKVVSQWVSESVIGSVE